MDKNKDKKGNIKDAIAMARRYVAEGDTNLAVFVVRDYEELEEFRLKDLAWAMYKNYATPKEVSAFLDDLEERLSAPSQVAP